MIHRTSSSRCAALLAACAALAACDDKKKEIQVYRVEREAPADAIHQSGTRSGSAPAGMPAGAEGADPHAGLSASQLSAVGTPAPVAVRDEAPTGWTRQPPNTLRLRSYRVDGEGGAMTDISLVTLRGARGHDAENLNRWREQLGLPPLDEAALKLTTLPVETGIGQGVMVELEGLAQGADPLKDGRMIGAIAAAGSDAWFFKMRGNDAVTAAQKEAFLAWLKTVKTDSPAAAAPAAAPTADTAPSATGAAPTGQGPLTWTLPTGWVVQPNASAMRHATFTVPAAAGGKAEVVITTFPGDVGGDLANVNRWRGQTGLGPTDQDALAQAVGTLTAGTKKFSLIDLNGPQSRTIAAWTRHGDASWFIKLGGPDTVVGAAKADFTRFVESIRFTQPE